MDMSSQMLIFANVVEHGSFSAAARKMGQTPSSVSKQIGMLEDQVHYRLLHRTRTGVLPTQEGQEFYEKCKAMSEKFKEAEALILNLDGVPRGTLKIASSVAFGKSQLIPALPRFLADNREVEVSLDLTDRDVDMQGEGFDAIIGFAEQRKTPDIVARRIMKSRRVLCASPSYLAQHGCPRDFSEMAQHNCLRINSGKTRNTWCQGPHDKGQDFEAQGDFAGNSTDVVYHAAIAGIGIARLPFYMTEQKFLSGELVHVLPDYSLPSTDIAVMFAQRRNLAPKTRAFVDFLVDQFREIPAHKMAGS